MPKDDEAKIREEQQKQEDERKKQEEERKKQREAAVKRMEESQPTPTQEENDEAINKALSGGVSDEAKRSTEAAPPSGTYSTRTATPAPKKEKE
jgi:hypothetical protein